MSTNAITLDHTPAARHALSRQMTERRMCKQLHLQHQQSLREFLHVQHLMMEADLTAVWDEYEGGGIWWIISSSDGHLDDDRGIDTATAINLINAHTRKQAH